MSKFRKKKNQDPADKPDTSRSYSTGKTGPEGTYLCTSCKKSFTLKKPGRLPPCPKCSKSDFSLTQKTETVKVENTGNYLRTLRLGKGLSIKEVSEATRISQTNLNAIEDQDFPSLPANTFTRGLLNIYTSFLGADTETIVSNFMEERENSSSQKRRAKQKTPSRILAPKRLAEPAHISSVSMAGALLVVIIVSFTGYCFYTSWNPFGFLDKQNEDTRAAINSVFLEENEPEPEMPFAELVIQEPGEPETLGIDTPGTAGPEAEEAEGPAAPSPEGQKTLTTAKAETESVPNKNKPAEKLEKYIAGPALENETPRYAVEIRFLKKTEMELTSDNGNTLVKKFIAGDVHSLNADTSIKLIFSKPDSAKIFVNGSQVDFPEARDGTYTLQMP